MSELQDSGCRREFDSGAVRDVQEGKGRCDLLPLDVIAKMVDSEELKLIDQFKRTGDVQRLFTAIETFAADNPFYNINTALLEVAKHFEDGAVKYGDNNWMKGIPVHCYIDSAVRHYLKYCRNDHDEPHERAFIWNLLCCIWTVEHKPHLLDIGELDLPDDIVEDECDTVPMLTEKRFEEIEQFAELVKPLQQWLLEHYNPHSKIIIECNGATITTDDMFVPLEVGGSYGQ